MVRAAAFAVLIATLAGLGASSALAEPRAASRDPSKAPAGLYELDKRHASLTLRVGHMGLSGYTMRFDDFDARFSYDPADPEASKIEATINAASLDVGDAKLSQRFARELLDSEAAPKITFVSTAIHRAPPPAYTSAQPTDGPVREAGLNVTGEVTGDLTFRGVTKPVTLQVTFNGTGPGLLGGHRMGFSATGEIKRSDFGSHAFESTVGDVVHLDIEAEFQRK